MKSERKKAAPLECCKRATPLSRTPDTEEWLHQMAEEGLALDHICGRRFYFKRSDSQCLRYFLLEPESGTNSEAWVYYEFLQMGGKCIQSQGSTVLSPSLALAVDLGAEQAHLDLYRYYYSYRNYRYLRRFCRNALVFLVGAAVSAVLYALGGAGLLFLLQYGGIFLLIGLFQAFSARRFVQSCKRLEQPCGWKKPRRPGYGPAPAGGICAETGERRGKSRPGEPNCSPKDNHTKSSGA